MNDNGAADNYDIAVRQFQQQILPGGLWDVVSGRSDDLPATIVWGYGPAADPVPDASALGVAPGIAPAPNSQFNYPSYTVETTSQPPGSGTPVKVRWINDLVDQKGKYLSHLLPIDQTVHWANPPQRCADGTKRTDCSGKSKQPYKGPVPIITHVHGAHVNPESDGYRQHISCDFGVISEIEKTIHLIFIQNNAAHGGVAVDGWRHARARSVRERAMLGKRWTFLHAAGAGGRAQFRTTSSGDRVAVQGGGITLVIITVLPGTANSGPLAQ